MKYLPDSFPIRYAIFVDAFLDKNTKDDFDLSWQNALWFQLIQFLRVKPLALEDLSFGYTGAKYEDADGNKLCAVPRLNGTKEWADKLRSVFAENIKGGTFSSSRGSVFNLTAYSYEGMAEQPLFSRVMNATKENSERVIAELRLRELNYSAIEGLQKAVQIKYQQVVSGKANLWKNYGNINRPPVFFLEMPYSKMWKVLDRSRLGGIACFNNDNDLQKIHDAMDKIKDEDVDEKKTILVAVAKDVEALMLEEIAALYRDSTLCKGCGKPLPFGYKGKYCPETKENMACFRKRASKRQKKVKN